MGLVDLLLTGVLMIANLAVAGSLLIPGMQQYTKRSGAAVAAVWGVSLALAYPAVGAPGLSQCQLSTFDIVFSLVFFIADVALIGTIFVGDSPSLRRFRSSGVRKVTFTGLKGVALLGWMFLALTDFVSIVNGGGALSLINFLSATCFVIWLIVVQPAGEIANPPSQSQ